MSARWTSNIERLLLTVIAASFVDVAIAGGGSILIGAVVALVAMAAAPLLRSTRARGLRLAQDV